MRLKIKRRPLRQLQRDALARFHGERSAFFAMAMRLGKTLTCIRWALKEKRPGPVVIVAPKTVLYSWEKELAAEYLIPRTLSGLIPARVEAFQKIKGEAWILTNYEVFLSPDFVKAFEKCPPAVLILDESTRIKGHKAKTTQALLRVCDLVRHKACLSGLPSPQSLEDLWPQLAFLHDGRWMGCAGFYRWRKKNTVIDPTSYGEKGRVFLPAQGKRVIDAFQASAFCCTLQQAADHYGMEMPEKIYSQRRGELSQEERKGYAHILKTMEIPRGRFEPLSRRLREWEGPDPLGQKYEADHAIVCLTWLRMLPGFLPSSWKYSELVEIAKELGTEKLVVWFAFSGEIAQAKKRLALEGIKAGELHGDTSEKERRKVLGAFDEGLRVLLIQEKLGQFGLNLAKASTALYFSNSYSLEERAQSEDRIFLPGKRNLLIIDLVTKGTVDDEILDTLKAKRKTSARTLARQVLGEH